MPSPSHSPAGRRRWKLIAATATLPLLAAGIAAPQSPALAVQKKTQAAPQRVTATSTVTLITGDVVTVSTLSDGTQTAAVQRPAAAKGRVHVETVNGDIYVLPDEALPLLAADKLDRRLFDVTDLIEMGYDDSRTAGVPLIATYTPTKTRSAPTAPKGSKLGRRFASIGAAALTADKKQSRTFWKTIAPETATARTTPVLGAGVAKVWLDGRVKVSLADSVPQIGAPEAWAAGYDGDGVKVAVLDTGVDATHPDLVDQIDEKVSFVPGEDTSDLNGHGTHVASTIVGTGAASGGTYKGVAPGADLIVGKVLSNQGFGADSWIIAGMQWAAESGASIVNMSLGDPTPSDGTDPMSAAVDALSAQYGTLFVIASGNAGPETIGSPGAAASALTVGAVDKQDNLAYFSSTGPQIKTGGIKPDITAPGVDITAARSQQQDPAQGEGMYWSISGTSMATPHVAGSAAILKQRHPGWTGPQLKANLTSTAKGLADWYSPYEVGTGRLDVAAAVKSTVSASGPVLFGNFTWPDSPSQGPVTKTVTFTNTGAAATTLNLATTSERFSVAASSVTVAAGGTATVDVVGDPSGAEFGRHGGWLVGTDAATGAPVTRTSLAFIKEDERYDLTFKLTGRDGQPASGTVVYEMAGDFWGPYLVNVDGERTLRLPPGKFSAWMTLDVAGEKPDSRGSAELIAPRIELNKNTVVSLDASKALRVDIAAPQRVEDRRRTIDYVIDYGDGMRRRVFDQIPIWYDDIYISPTTAYPAGAIDMELQWRQGERMFEISTLGGLVRFDATAQPGATLTAGKSILTAVYAGDGSPSAYNKIKAKGKLVVVTRSDAVTTADRVAAATAAGAKALVVVNDGVGILNEVYDSPSLPIATVHRDAGQVLIGLARSGVLPFTVTQVPYASFTYDLGRTLWDTVPDRPVVFHPKQSDLARIDARYYKAVGSEEGGGIRNDSTLGPIGTFLEREWYPGTRTEWVTPDTSWTEVHVQGIWTDVAEARSYAKGSVTRQDWFAPAVRPAFNRTFAVANERSGDYLTLHPLTWTPSGTAVAHGALMDWGSVPEAVKLYQGDTLLRENDLSSDLQYVEVSPGRLPYRLVLDASRPAETWRLSTRTHTEWKFFSDTTPDDRWTMVPLMQLDYQLDTDLRGDAKPGRQRLAVKAGSQPGGTGIGKVSAISLDISYNDGQSWQKVTLRKGSNGWWQADVTVPSRAGGFLSVRASASTDAGYAIQQEIIRAYGLG